ncbi:MAG: hypothetical protein KDA41_03035 [Planctomycetales bacterium]|nr:hypothetical protein [Planctomycetales bacterium]
MPDPQKHASNRGMLEWLLRKIPGFKGYLEKSYRRESDRLQREWLADHLQRAKQGLTDYTLALTNAGQIDQLAVCDQMRSRLDRLIARLRGGVSGYSGFFDFVQIGEDELESVYAHDSAMSSDVETLGEELANLASATEPPAVLMPQLLAKIDRLAEKVDRREDMLRGLSG